MMSLHPVFDAVTRRIRERSQPTRAAYLERLRAAAAQGPRRLALGCANRAHGFAGCTAAEDKEIGRAHV